MKTTNIQSSYAGFDDHYITYEGTVQTKGPSYPGHYGDGTWQEFTITTEIRNNLSVFIICSVLPELRGDEPTYNIPTGLQSSFILPHKVTLTNKKEAIITFRAPMQCNVSYRVSGSTTLLSKISTLNKELSATSSVNAGFEEFGHKHDGLDSKRITASNIAADPGNAGKFVRVDASGQFLTYADSTTPTLQDFSLLTPVDYAVLDADDAFQTFTWEECEEHVEDYHFYIVKENDTPFIVYDITASGESVNVFTSELVTGYEYGTVFRWYVVAYNGTETLQTVPFRFTVQQFD